MNDLAAGLRAAAFHGAEGLDDRALAQAASAGSLERWLSAVVLGARGWYARAVALLEPLAAGQDPVLASLAASTLGSHRRQLGGHGEARKWDAVALGRLAGARPGELDPDGVDLAGATADALIGLAADAVGAGRIAEARVLAGRTESGLTHRMALLTGWRARVRHGWVLAELELAAGNSAAARGPAERAGVLAREHGATRHAVKSDIVLAAALITSSQELERAAELLRRALDTAAVLELDSLIWPAETLARSIELDVGTRVDGTSALHRVLLRSDAFGRDLAAGSPWMPVAP